MILFSTLSNPDNFLLSSSLQWSNLTQRLMFRNAGSQMFRVATIALNLDLELFFKFFFYTFTSINRDNSPITCKENTYIKSLATHVGTRMLYRPEAPRFMLPVQESTKNQKQLTTHTRKKSQWSSSTSIKLAVSMNHIRNVWRRSWCSLNPGHEISAL